jgi:hypothetical protein
MARVRRKFSDGVKHEAVRLVTVCGVSMAQATRFQMLRKVRGKDTISVVSALQREIGKMPAALRLSLT